MDEHWDCSCWHLVGLVKSNGVHHMLALVCEKDGCENLPLLLPNPCRISRERSVDSPLSRVVPHIIMSSSLTPLPEHCRGGGAGACGRGALELAEGVCYPEARLVCGAWLSFGRGKRGRFHPQNFAKTRHFTRSDSSRFAF